MISKRITFIIIAFLFIANCSVFAADFSTDERGIFTFEQKVDVSKLTDDDNYINKNNIEPYSKMMTYKILNPGYTSQDLTNPANYAAAIQNFGQVTIDDSGDYSFTVRIKGSTGTYKLILSNPILGSREYQIDYVSNIYVDFNDVAAKGVTDEMESFIVGSAYLMGFDITSYNLLCDEDKYSVIQQLIDKGKVSGNKELIEFTKSLDLVSKLFKNATDANKLAEYINSTYKEADNYFNTPIAKVFEEELIDASKQLTVARMLIGKTLNDSTKNMFELNVLKAYVSGFTYFTDISKVVNNVDNIWDFNESDLIKYSNLSNKNTVLRSIYTYTDSATSLDDYRTKFSNLVTAEYEDEHSSSSGSGSGRSSGKSSSFTVSPGTAAVSTPVATTQEIATVAEKNKVLPFDDISDVAWAVPAITKLADKLIIFGDSDNKFLPNNSTTREEFVKMLTSGLRLTGAEAVVLFKDVREDDWFYLAVGAASRANIIMGDADGNFGVGKNITREDAAVMLNRTLAFKGVGLKTVNSVIFSDDTDISSYAKNSVYKLANAGIINGLGDNTLAPKKNLTKAEAAKMLCEFFVAIDVLK